jgi:hypothetical protein
MGVKIRVTAVCEYAGCRFPAGRVLNLNRRAADWFIANGVGEVVPEVPKKTAIPLTTKPEKPKLRTVKLDMGNIKRTHLTPHETDTDSLHNPEN